MGLPCTSGAFISTVPHYNNHNSILFPSFYMICFFYKWQRCIYDKGHLHIKRALMMKYFVLCFIWIHFDLPLSLFLRLFICWLQFSSVHSYHLAIVANRGEWPDKAMGILSPQMGLHLKLSESPECLKETKNMLDIFNNKIKVKICCNCILM